MNSLVRLVEPIAYIPCEISAHLFFASFIFAAIIMARKFSTTNPFSALNFDAWVGATSQDFFCPFVSLLI